VTEDRENGAHPGQRPAGRDGFDPSRVCIRLGTGEVIVKEDDERLPRRDPGGSGPRRSSGPQANGCQHEGRRQRASPARAGGAREVTGRTGHPVNVDGPRRGCSAAAAQAR
jgi:hypothetical protein